MSRAEIYRDEAGEWRWRVVAGNGEIVASGESYTSRRDAARGLRDARRAMNAADTAGTAPTNQEGEQP